LHVEPVEQPEDIVELRPIDRGSLVHAILDRFVREEYGNGDVADEDGARQRLHEITDEECERLAAQGLTGRPLLWVRARRMIHDAVEAWFVADRAFRSEGDLHTVATEYRFGPIELPLSDGRSVRFRGAVDRVDASADGHLIVIDYKTGSAWRAFDEDDPLLGGTKLQLPVYALAARDAVGASADAPVEALYWFVGRGEDKRVGYVVDDGIASEFDRTLREIVDGIEGGCFPSRPEPPGPRFYVACEYCDPDHLGTSDRFRDWSRKAFAPELERYVALTGAVE